MAGCLPRSVTQISRFTCIVNNHRSDWMIIAGGPWSRKSYIYHNTFLSGQYRSAVFVHGHIRLWFSWASASFTVVLFSHCICCLDRMFYQRKCSLWKRRQLVVQLTLVATNYLAGTRLIYLFRYELTFALLLCHTSKAVRLKSCWLKQALMQISISTIYCQLFILYVR